MLMMLLAIDEDNDAHHDYDENDEMMMRPASVATLLEMGKGTTRSQMSSLVSLHHSGTLHCDVALHVLLECTLASVTQ